MKKDVKKKYFSPPLGEMRVCRNGLRGDQWMIVDDLLEADFWPMSFSSCAGFRLVDAPDVIARRIEFGMPDTASSHES
jgi:hypothetical protein